MSSCGLLKNYYDNEELLYHSSVRGVVQQINDALVLASGHPAERAGNIGRSANVLRGSPAALRTDERKVP